MTLPQPQRVDVPAIRGWLLIEHPGPWGFSAGADTPVLPAAVRAAAAALGFRVNLIRQHRLVPRPGRERCFVSSSAGGRQLLERLPVDRLADRFAGVAEALAAGRPSGLATPVAEPMYLVCTNSRRSPVCGGSGRSVARAVSAAAGPRAWETTHVGGCRFAANLVCLPSGVFYRGMGPAEAVALVAAADRGRIVLSRYRGRAGLSPQAQAAEWAVRQATGLDGVDALRVAEPGPPGDDDRREVPVATPAGTYRVTVRPRDRAGQRYDVIAVTAPDGETGPRFGDGRHGFGAELPEPACPAGTEVRFSHGVLERKPASGSLGP
ncbi:sucrase ferredoxin [Actinoplanes sichuanensis]|uniref:Sucrase ferredoxin n=1 Tax=Actinoplanes sichuanensis TaxID=512349 RepID=A0ABW4A4E1_9ACTN|nr:sucrase ferredoxin [Actinoplanes sichuanensis]BEL03178.1 sucrase ferredoxin [Actinoplanes sichuanensis]